MRCIICLVCVVWDVLWCMIDLLGGWLSDVCRVLGMLCVMHCSRCFANTLLHVALCISRCVHSVLYVVFCVSYLVCVSYALRAIHYMLCYVHCVSCCV